MPILAITAAMRNEGIHLIEWIAYHQVIGFDRVIIHSNDCTDGSDALLDHLAAQGVIEHLSNPVPEGEAPQTIAMRAVLGHLEAQPADWLLHCDADEFLDIGLGAGLMSDLMAGKDAADVIALPWRTFGDNGHDIWPGTTLPHFTACEGVISPDTVKFKSLFRPDRFAFANDHMPVEPKIADPKVVSASGTPLQNDELFAAKRSKYRPLDLAIAPEAAVLNHYATRSSDVFLMKNDRGDGQGKLSNKYHLGSRWHSLANRNDAQERRILRHWPQVEARMRDLRADPVTARLERACLDWWERRKAQVLTDANLAAWTKAAYRKALA